MKKIFSILLFVLFTPVLLWGQSRNIVAIDTPSAFTIERGTYHVSMLGYEGGGIELKTLIGLHDNLYLGVSLDLQNAIGTEDPKPNIPGVIARIKLTDGWESWPISIALGYDSFFIGRQGIAGNADNDYNQMIYGPYLAVTKPIYLLGGEQYMSFGVRVPVQPYADGNDTSYYFALDIPLGSFFRVKGEVERIYWNLRDSEDWLFNFGFRYTYMDALSLELDFLYQPGETMSRIVRIEYRNRF